MFGVLATEISTLVRAHDKIIICIEEQIQVLDKYVDDCLEYLLLGPGSDDSSNMPNSLCQLTSAATQAYASLQPVLSSAVHAAVDTISASSTLSSSASIPSQLLAAAKQSCSKAGSSTSPVTTSLQSEASSSIPAETPKTSEILPSGYSHTHPEDRSITSAAPSPTTVTSLSCSASSSSLSSAPETVPLVPVSSTLSPLQLSQEPLPIESASSRRSKHDRISVGASTQSLREAQPLTGTQWLDNFQSLLQSKRSALSALASLRTEILEVKSQLLVNQPLPSSGMSNNRTTTMGEKLESTRKGLAAFKEAMDILSKSIDL